MIAAADYDAARRVEGASWSKPAVECGPVAWSAASRMWIVTRHEDCLRTLRDRRFMALDIEASVARVTTRAGEPMPHLRAFLRAALVGMDGEGHRMLRGVFARTFNARPFAAILPEMEARAAALWTTGVARGSIDVVNDYAEPLIGGIAGLIVGLDGAQAGTLAACLHSITTIFNGACPLGAYRAHEEQLAVAMALVDGILHDRRAHPRADGATQFALLADQTGLSAEDAAATFVALFFSSYEQSASIIGLAIRTLLGHPAALAAWRGDELDEATAVDELFRFETLAPRTIRIPQEDTEVGGVAIRGGDHMLLLLESANRDPAVFGDPDRLDLRRAPNPHIAFSDGAHACLGPRIAKAELSAALAPMRHRPPARILTREVQWWRFDLLRRMRSFEVAF